MTRREVWQKAQRRSRVWTSSEGAIERALVFTGSCLQTGVVRASGDFEDLVCSRDLVALALSNRALGYGDGWDWMHGRTQQSQSCEERTVIQHRVFREGLHARWRLGRLEC